MILYLEDPKNSTRKLVGLVNEFSKVAIYKIKMHKSNAFVFISYEIEENLRRWKDLPCSWVGRNNSQNGHSIKGTIQIQCNSS